MNSNLIKTRFGSYGVEVLVQEPDLRIASLYSLEGTGRVTRSLAVVHYINQQHHDLTAVHQCIVAGASIGQSFVDEGFEVVKETEALVELAIDDGLINLYNMMHLSAPAPLAYHTYVLNVRKQDEWIAYARVTEVHSPVHLSIDALLSRYGDQAYYQVQHPRYSDLLTDFRGFFLERVKSAS